MNSECNQQVLFTRVNVDTFQSRVVEIMVPESVAHSLLIVIMQVLLLRMNIQMFLSPNMIVTQLVLQSKASIQSMGVKLIMLMQELQ